MAEGFGIQGAATGVQSNLAVGANGQAAEAASTLPQAPTAERGGVRQPTANVAQPTSYVSDPAVQTQVHSKVVQRLVEQGATPYAPGLARVPLPARPDGTPRTAPKKPAGPMVAPRTLDGGKSPLAPTALFDARASLDTLGVLPGSAGVDVEADWTSRLDALESFLEASA